MVSEEIGGLLARMSSTNLDGDDEPDISQDVIAERTRHLEKVLESLKQLWDYRSDELEDLLEKLGTGSRDASWRIPIGDSGILDYALELLPHDEFETGPKIQALRLIGNSCADTEENRARVVQGAYVPVIAGLLGPVNSDDLLPYVITSLHNICVDYGQQLTRSPHLVGITSKTIALLASNDQEKEKANVSTPLTLLKLACNPSWPSRSVSLAADDFCNLVSAAAAYLTNERLLATAAASIDSPIVFDALYAACTRYSCAKLEDMDEAEQLGRVRKSLVGTVADLTGRDEFQQQQRYSGNDNDENTTTTNIAPPIRTNIHALFDLFRRADPEPTKTECARTAMALCRLLHQSDADVMLPWPEWAPSSSSPSRRAAFYNAHAGLDELLSFLLVQTRFPALRSEAWFVLALMSRSPDGAKVVVRALTRTDAALAAVMTAAGVGQGSAVVEAGEEKSGGPGEEAAAELGIDGLGLEPRQADPKQMANMARIDRENVLVLLTELLRNQVDDDLREDHRRKLEAALRTGGGIVMDERAKASGSTAGPSA
ncbi:hypothetical protein MAPG_06293 [Magnaporthiopsis poae ATCC 64411]|uniref:GTP binding protein n=1 Tax=Magnaporthiopsis poae (strain ATCC 64411 / 73-15) TaxID=644358 RepID=A0A0C4E1M8_MAGP6|nr:hypothetical protein MAPG_06293 [Magnaporthiopsis poae ATCC 64411]